MPRDAHLLSEMSQWMLRVARLPATQAPDASPEEQEKHKKQEKEKRDKEEALAKGFKMNKWTQMPKGYDPPDVEVLAKRRKGLPASFDNLSSLYTTVVQPVALRPAKVRKIDHEGMVRVYNVMAAVSQVVEGEIPEGEQIDLGTVVPTPPVGTIVDGVGIVNADGVLIAQPTPRRKMPPPRRKPKKGGPGRSKRKIIAELGPDGVPLQQPYVSADGQPQGASGADGTEGGDTPMPDAQDGEDDDDSGEEGEIMDEDDEREDGELSVEGTPVRPSSALSREVTVDEPAPVEAAQPAHGASSLRTEITVDEVTPTEEPVEADVKPAPEEPEVQEDTVMTEFEPELEPKPELESELAPEPEQAPEEPTTEPMLIVEEPEKPTEPEELKDPEVSQATELEPQSADITSTEAETVQPSSVEEPAEQQTITVASIEAEPPIKSPEEAKEVIEAIVDVEPKEATPIVTEILEPAVDEIKEEAKAPSPAVEETPEQPAPTVVDDEPKADEPPSIVEEPMSPKKDVEVSADVDAPMTG
jgi:hypothetical protein